MYTFPHRRRASFVVLSSSRDPSTATGPCPCASDRVRHLAPGVKKSGSAPPTSVPGTEAIPELSWNVELCKQACAAASQAAAAAGSDSGLGHASVRKTGTRRRPPAAGDHHDPRGCSLNQRGQRRCSARLIWAACSIFWRAALAAGTLQLTANPGGDRIGTDVRGVRSARARMLGPDAGAICMAGRRGLPVAPACVRMYPCDVGAHDRATYRLLATGPGNGRS